MYESDNLNLEDTGKLMTGSGMAGRRKKIILIAVAVAAVVLIAVLGIKLVGDKKYNDQVAVAEKAMMEGDYAQAETEYLKAVDMKHRKPRAREGLAYVYALQGKFDEAARTYNDLYGDTGDEKHRQAGEDTGNGYFPYDEELVPVRFWRYVDLESIQYSMELVRFLTNANNDFTPEGHSFSYDDQNSEAGADLLQGIMEGKFEPTYLIPVGAKNITRDSVIADEYRDWQDWDYQGTDPKGWKDGHPDMMRFKAETVDWILTELFNVPEDTFKAWQKKGEENHKFYLADDGYYYSFCWIDADEGGAVDPVTLRTDGVNFCVEYYSGNYAETDVYETEAIVDRYDTDGFVDWPVDISDGDYATCYAMLELKSIDGKRYWSMHYNGTDLPPDLRDAGNEEPTEKTGGTQVVTEMNEVMEDELIDFLSYLPYYTYGGMRRSGDESKGRCYYNYKEAADCEILFGMMWNVQCINMDKYPVDFERTELWDTGESDPLGRAVYDDGEAMMCYKTNADAVNWVAKNIFNVSQEELDKEVQTASRRTEAADPSERTDGFYEYEGYYYLITGGMGWETSYDFKIDDVKVEGDYFNIAYTEYDYIMGEDTSNPEALEFRVKMQYKIIDGKGYWSLYTREMR